MANKDVGDLLVERDRHLHVKLTSGELLRLQDAKNNSGYSKWRDWLLSLPDQFRILHERGEMFRLKAEDLEQENAALKIRLGHLQADLED